MAAYLKRFPNGMGGSTVCYPAPSSIRDANEWLNRIGARGFKFSSTDYGKIQELRINGKKVIRVKMRNSSSVIPICQIAASAYNLKIDWYNPVNWQNVFKYPEDIQIQTA
jgi:hypothetical protein